MRRITIMITTVILMTLGWVTAISGASAHGAVTPNPAKHSTAVTPRPQTPGPLISQFEWCDNYDGLCMHDPNGGGVNTSVLMDTDNGHDSFDWALQSNGGLGCTTVTSTCPGGWLSANEAGDSIVTLRNIGGSNTNNSDLCLGFSNSTGWLGVMKTCDGYQGGSYPATILIYDTDQTDCTGSGAFFYSWNWQNVGGGTNGIMFAGGVSGAKVGITSGVSPPCTAYIWNAFTS